ncbi:MAG: metallophosphoesterase [Lentisphaeria bacterium]|nr:metallophosphoesterase [Lentisphaeria bacterium]NQZ70929.1 metallophosphoesterase [Lentisphaeria bacterium]
MRRIVHHIEENHATIKIEGLTDSYRLLHLTDCHILKVDERDGALQETFAAVAERREPNHLAYAEMMERIKTMEADLLVLSGDVVEAPSAASVEFAMAGLDQLPYPFIFTPGNHDWNFEQVRFDDEELQKGLVPLEPLHRGNPSFHAMQCGEIRVLHVDNSDYQINAEQLEFLREEFAREEPMVLVIHIPLSLPTLREACIDKWKSAIMIGDPVWNAKEPGGWGAQSLTTKETWEAIELISNCKNLAAVLCGHLHFQHTDVVSDNCVQYLGGDTTSGYLGILDFKALE